MFKFLKNKSKHINDSVDKGKVNAKILSKTNNNLSLGKKLNELLLGRKTIDDDLLEDIETQLLLSDVSVETSENIISKITNEISRENLSEGKDVYEKLKIELKNILKPNEEQLKIDTSKKPFVILVVGSNGVGKTTTIGKLAKQFQKNGLSSVLAAGDTFRAAAVEQLKIWGERNNIPVIAQQDRADSASVIYDAIESAKSKKNDIVIADTAGRLHNKDGLMEELKKIIRVIGKIDNQAPHEILLVLDANMGQNAIQQAESFKSRVGITGLAITKLDGTAKGGVIFEISEKLKLPIRFIGVGENIDDLKTFDCDDFINSMFETK
jgi:fused signal recognition particle receptor